MRPMTNIQIICKLQPNSIIPCCIMIKYLFLLFFAFGLSACYNDTITYNDKLPIGNIRNINISLSFYPSLLVPTGFAIVDGGVRGLDGKVLVVCIDPNRGDYLAFDLAAPHLTLDECATPMSYDDSTNFYCISLCDSEEVKYHINSPSTEVDGVFYTMREYVAISDGNTIIITSN